MKRTLSFLYLFLFFLTRPWALELPEAENLFDKVFGSKEKESGRAIIQLRDGGYCLTGEKEGKKGTSLWVLRLDSKGKILWERVRGAHQKNRGLNLLETEDGGILVAGFRSILTRH
ncbi:hypothetical protein HOF92_04405, partial [bacterium]|nr:hypothetical protein [bacterium]